MKKHLNFIPKELKAKWEFRHELVPLTLLVLLMVYAAGGPLRLSLLTKVQETEIAQLEATQAELVEKAKAMNDQSKVAEQNSESLSAIQQVLARKNYWSEVFKEMSILVPEDVWLTNFTNMKTSGKAPGAPPESLTIKGYATTQLAVGRFLKILEDSSFFKGARMTFTERDKDIKPARFSFEFFIPVHMSGGAKR